MFQTVGLFAPSGCFWRLAEPCLLFAKASGPAPSGRHPFVREWFVKGRDLGVSKKAQHNCFRVEEDGILC